MFQIFQPALRSETEGLRRSALLLALIFLILCPPAPGQVLYKGMAVGTQFSGWFNSFPPPSRSAPPKPPCNTTGMPLCPINPLGNVIAIMDVRGKTTAGILPGTNWSNSSAYPANIEQVNGTCYSPTMPDGSNPPNTDGTPNPSGGPGHSILCYPPIGYGKPAPPPNGIYPSGGPSGKDPALLNVPSSYQWTAQTMGQVFGLALDNQGDIFATASSVYGDFNDLISAGLCPVVAPPGGGCPVNL